MTTLTANPGKERTLMGMCGYCAEGRRHDLCPGVTRAAPDAKLWRCQCPGPDCGQTRCTECYNRNRDEVTKDGHCIDRLACEEAMAARKAKVRREMLGRFADVSSDEQIARRPTKTPRRGDGTSRPTSGKCWCCDEPTKGGRFLPGHDSRWVTVQAKALVAGETTIQALVDKGTTPALLAKIEKRKARL